MWILYIKYHFNKSLKITFKLLKQILFLVFSHLLHCKCPLLNFSHCLRGTISCTGPPCADIEPVRACKQTGWTPWLSTPAFVGGDYEVLMDPRLKATLEDYCGIANMTEIDCRTVETKQSYKETGQRVSCRLPNGFSCNDDEQKDSVCEDYEIRVYCDCGKLHFFAEFSELNLLLIVN